MNYELDLPELENLFFLVSSWDFNKDLIEEKGIIKNIEDDLNILYTNNNNEVNESKANDEDSDEEMRIIDTSLKIKSTVIEPLKLKYSNSEEYVNINYSLFLLECKSQISRAKFVEMDKSESFLIKDGKIEKKFFLIEVVRGDKEKDKENHTITENIQYSQGDLVVLTFERIDMKESISISDLHVLSVVDRNTSTSIFLKISMNLSNNRIASFVSQLKKGSNLYISRVCNLATSIREYQALMSIDSLLLSDIILHPGEINNINLDKEKDFFNIPFKLKFQIESFFDSSQVEALLASIKKRGVTLIQGPPGTGKSTTILGILSVILNSYVRNDYSLKVDRIDVDNDMTQSRNEEMNVEEIYNKTHPWVCNSDYYNWNDEPISISSMKEFITCSKTDRNFLLNKATEEEISPPERVLVCAPSNVAIDEIVRKIISSGLMNSEGQAYNPKFIRIGPNYHPSIKDYCLDYIIQSKSQVEEVKDNEKLRQDLLSSAKIICSTLSIAGSNTLLSLNQKFDTVIIDEAGQSIEISSIIPLKYYCERLILVGDPNQLCATVFSRSAIKYKYEQSLFKRFEECGEKVTILKTQYRMHPLISRFISQTFYNDKLIDSDSVKEINEKCYSLLAFQPFVFYDIESKESFDGNSYYNDGQISLVTELISLLQSIYTLEEMIERIAIISPYSSQVLKIKIGLRKILKYSDVCPIEVNTVDGFQGKEKRIIIFSTVRSKGGQSIGFLKDEKRMNVGLSRAKACLIVIGDSKKLILDLNWEKLVKFSYKNAFFYKVPSNVNCKSFVKSLQEALIRKSNDIRISSDEDFIKAVYSSNLNSNSNNKK